MSKIETWKVDGMRCSGCEASVRRVLAGLAGLLRAEPDHASGSVRMEIDEARIDRDEAQLRIEGAGFDVVSRGGAG